MAGENASAKAMRENDKKNAKYGGKKGSKMPKALAKGGKKKKAMAKKKSKA